MAKKTMPASRTRPVAPAKAASRATLMLFAAVGVALAAVLAVASLSGTPGDSPVAAGKTGGSGKAGDGARRERPQIMAVQQTDEFHALPANEEGLRDAADEGDTLAMFKLAVGLANGDFGVTINEEEAATVFNKCAKLGDVNCMYNLGHMYHTGTGYERNDEWAVYWFRKAAADGDMDSALLNLGLILHAQAQGTGTPKDASVDELHAEARSCFEKLAERGHAQGAYMFASYLVHGSAGASDHVKAVELLEMPAEAGIVEAQALLAQLLVQGRDVEFDGDAALKWALAAAGNGNTGAMVLLGALHANGMGTPVDARQAKHWWLKAAKLGNKDAAYNLEAMRTKAADE